MIENFREFTVGPDPFGRNWHIRFLWQQTAISIRHSDSVDVKFALSDGEVSEEKVIALMLPHLLDLSSRKGRPLNDAWCMKLAAYHLSNMILTGEDVEKSLVTMTVADLEKANSQIDATRQPATA